jgi:hypothetical protein
MLTTTIVGKNFYETGLDYYDPDDTIGLPGLGPAAKKKLTKFGLINAAAVFGQYLAFNRDREIFIYYLEQIVGVVFVGNHICNNEEIKNVLCDILDAKYRKIELFMDW